AQWAVWALALNKQPMDLANLRALLDHETLIRALEPQGRVTSRPSTIRCYRRSWLLARRRLGECQSLCEALGNAAGLAHARLHLGIAISAGKPPAARGLQEHAPAVIRHVGDPGWIAWCCCAARRAASPKPLLMRTKLCSAHSAPARGCPYSPTYAP